MFSYKNDIEFKKYVQIVINSKNFKIIYKIATYIINSIKKNLLIKEHTSKKPKSTKQYNFVNEINRLLNNLTKIKDDL